MHKLFKLKSKIRDLVFDRSRSWMIELDKSFISHQMLELFLSSSPTFMMKL